MGGIPIIRQTKLAIAIALCVPLLAASADAQAGGSAVGRIFTVAGTPWDESGPLRAFATGRALGDPGAVAALPDGSFLVTDEARVWLVDTAGRMTVAAGRGSYGFSGDGGPASAARLDAPSGLALLPDGGFLVSDSYNHRVRRVSADGIITTVAGNGDRGMAGDGGPAVQAQISTPRALALLPDGGFLVADEGEGRVRRVGPDGTISTLIAGIQPDGLLARRDGTVLVADGEGDVISQVGPDGSVSTFARVASPGALSATDGGDVHLEAGARVWRIRPGGERIAVAGKRSSRYGVSGDGEIGTRAELGYVNDIAVLPDGGLLIAGEESVRRVQGTGASAPLAAAIRLTGTASARGYRARIVLTRPARVTVRLVASDGARPAAVALARGRREAGESTVRAVARRPLRPGVYAIELVASGAGAAARAVVWADLGGRLTESAVREFSGSTPEFVRAADAGLTSSTTLCRRLSATRIDCVWVRHWTDELPEPGDVTNCSTVSAYLLRRSGQVSMRDYACPTRRSPRIFKPRPRWTGSSEVELRNAWG